MTLHSTAVLEVNAFDRTGVFEFKEFEPSREIERDFLVGGRGQVLSTLYEQSTELDPTGILPEIENERRAGYHVDAGGGRSLWTLQAKAGTGDEELQWGDGSSVGGEANQYDATGDVPARTKRDIFFRYLSQARTDSGGQAFLYTSEWTDGTYAGSAGVYGEPIPVAVLSARAESPKDEPGVSTYSLELVRTRVVPDVDELTEDLSEAAETAADELGDLIPDY